MKLSYILIFTLFVTSLVNAQDINSDTDGPVLMFNNWISGIKNNDLEKFKDGYLQADWDKMTDAEKNQLLKTYKQGFDSFGFENYVVEDFKTSYEGSETNGVLKIIFIDKKLRDLSVKNVNGDWVLAEK